MNFTLLKQSKSTVFSSETSLSYTGLFSYISSRNANSEVQTRVKGIQIISRSKDDTSNFLSPKEQSYHSASIANVLNIHLSIH